MLKFDQKYLTIDTETEGLNLYYSRPWQVSWVEHQGTKKIAEYDLYIDLPDLFIPDRIKKLTGFNQKKYDSEKKPAEEVWDILSERIMNPEYKIIGQNILNFDIFMIGVLQRLAKVSVDFSYLPRIIDTLALAKAWKHELTYSSKNFLEWQFKIINDNTLKKRVNQEQLLKDLEIDFDKSKLHDALYDVGKTKAIFDKLKKQLNL